MRTWRSLTASTMIVAMVCVVLECPLCPGATPSFDGGIVIKSGDPEYAEGGTWEIHKVGDYYLWPMDSVDCRKTSSAGAWAKWTPDLKAGKHRVYWWHNRFWWGNSGQVTIEIRHAGGTATIKRDNGDGPIGWSNLGDYEFAAGTGGYLKITMENKGTMYASGAKFLPADSVDKTTFPPYPKPDGSLPRAEKGNIVVCGQPRLVLYGETYEDVMTDAGDVPYYGDQFDKWRRQGLNTVGAIIQWNRFELRKDVYEYAMIDGLIEAAKARNMHLIIVWFGTWRNLQSNYVPGYIWTEKIGFPALKKDGKPENGGVSPFATKCAERDGLALNKLLARAALKDPGHQVLIAVQVENEMPCYTDFCPAANERIGEQVPKELLGYLKASDTPKYDPTKLGWFTWSRYHGNGSRTSGSWEEVLGKQPWPNDARQLMGAYYTGKYIEIVVRKAKEALNIPMYANAWVGASPCDSQFMDIFHIGCPSLDGMGPDSPGDNLFQWVRPWNMLVEPEFSAPENYFRALSLAALLNGHYCANEIELGARAPIGKVVRDMEPLLVTKRDPGDLLGFLPAPAPPADAKKLAKAGHSWEQDYQNLKVRFTLTGDVVHDTPNPHTAGPVLGPNGLIMRMGRDEHIITSTKVDVELRRADGSGIAAAWAEQGHFENGKWVKERDATVEAAGKSLKLRFPTENLKYGQIRLKIADVTAAAPEAPATGPGSSQLVWRTGWLGNTFKGGDWNKGRWVQIDIDDIFVFPDGRVVTNTIWDEACRAIGFYRDGDVIGKVDDPTALTGGLAVTADDQFIFALRLERKLGDSDPMWQGVARYTLEGKPAKWPGAEGRMRNVLFLHPPFDKGGKSLTGVAARDGELFLADPISRMVKVYGTSDMAAKREFKLNPDSDTPYKMVFDKSGRLWIGQKGKEGKWRLRAYDARAGAYANLEIPDPGEPAGLALAPDGRLAVADNGPRQQVRFYAVDGAVALKGALGVEGGIYAAPNPGRVADDRFGGLTGVGLDQQGNVYVSSNGRGPGDDNGFGAKLQKFDPGGKCVWTLEGLEFVDSADIDPGEETSVFSKATRFEVDWSKPTAEGWPHAGWAHRALTIHRFKYPNDPRLHIRQEGVRVVRVRGGRKLQSCQWDGHLCVYRFDGEIAVPAAVFSRSGSKPGEWPPNNPHNHKAWMWADKNGDGDFQADEFDAIAPRDIDVMRAYFLDEEGTAWIGEQNGTIHRFPLEPGDGTSGPLCALKTRTTVKAPEDITNIRSLRYVAGQDTMFLATYSKANPMQTWYPMAREIRRYDQWSTDRKLAWKTEIPYRFSGNRGRDILPICMDAEGDYVFVAYTLGAGDKEQCGEIVVFRAGDGSRVGSLWAGPEVGGRIGAIDFSSAVHVHKRADGTYVILVEDDLFAKIIYYVWKPNVAGGAGR